jgi:mannitol-1-/sugar-/sorbitol-6-phosphatase
MIEKPNRVVIFDLDGVLVDSTAVVEQAWRWWAEEQGLDIGHVLAVAHGRLSREVVRELAPHLDSEEQARRLDGWETDHSEGMTAVPGAADCLATARRGAWAIVTSGGRELATERLLGAGLPLPPVLVTADDVERGKPHPEPYEHAARALRVAPASCVVVEDAPAGIAAAKEAGMKVLAVSTTHEAGALGQADLVFGSMHEIHAHLAGAARRVQ